MDDLFNQLSLIENHYRGGGIGLILPLLGYNILIGRYDKLIIILQLY